MRMNLLRIYSTLSPNISGTYWHSHRKLLTPAFHFKILEGFLSIFHKNGEILVKKLKRKINNGGLEIYMDISMYALDVICGKYFSE